MGKRYEPRFEGRWWEVDALGEHVVEEAGELLAVVGGCGGHVVDAGLGGHPLRSRFAKGRGLGIPRSRRFACSRPLTLREGGGFVGDAEEEG